MFTPSDESGKFQYIIGYEVDESTEIPEGLTVYLIPPATYAIFTTPPASSEQFTPSIHQTWNQIYNEWFPASGYEQMPSPDFEWYDDRGMREEGKQMDIYIPVQPAAIRVKN